MNPTNEHQAFFKAKEAYETANTPATEKKLFNTMLPYLKQAVTSNDFDYFIRTLGEMDHYGFLEISTAANQIVWSVIGLLNKLKSNTDFPVQQFEEIFNFLKKLNYNRPSLEHSLILKFFLKRSDNYLVFEQFINWWDVKNLRTEDYQPEQFKDIFFPALAETLYSALSKSILLNAEKSLPLGVIEKNFLNSLAKELDSIYLQYPHYKYFPYYSARLQFTAGFTKNAMDTFLPFVRHNQKQFWAWELLADFYTADPAMQMAIFCRAMLCRADDQVKTGVQSKLFEAFLKNNMFDEGHEELDKIIQIKEQFKKRVLPELLSNKSKDWYHHSVNRHQAVKTYLKFANQADALLFDDQPAKIAVVSAFLADRGVAFVVTEDLINTKFKPAKFHIPDPEPGVLIELIAETIEGNLEVIRAKPASIELHEKLVQIVEGRIKIILPISFGILNGVFVPQELIVQSRINDGELVIAKALRSYDRKKDIWGWKAISLKNVME